MTIKKISFIKLEIGALCLISGLFLIGLSYTLKSNQENIATNEKNEVILNASNEAIETIQKEKDEMQNVIHQLQSEIDILKDDLNQKIVEINNNPKVIEKEVLVKDLFIPHSYINDIQIANFLEKEGIIKNAEEFVAYARKLGKSKYLKTGLNFIFKLNASNEEVLKILTE